MKKILLVLFVVVNIFALDLVQAKKVILNNSSTYNGVVYSKEQIMLASRLMGYVKKISVEEGDRVKKGQFLFEIDPSDIYSMINQARAGIMQAQSGVLMAKLAYDDAKKDFDRFQKLYKKGAVSKRDFEKMELNMKIRKAQITLAEGMLNQAKAGLQQALAQKKYAKVYSPIDGVVVMKKAKVSEMALPGHPILVLSSLNSLQVKAFVNEKEIQNLKVGDKAVVNIPSIAKKVNAEISAIIPSADMATHSYLVKFKLDNSKDLYPGMYALVNVVLSSNSSVVVPYNTLTSRGGVVGLFVVKNGVANFTPVKVVRQDGGEIVVTGISAGDEVVQYPKASLKDGQKI